MFLTVLVIVLIILFLNLSHRISKLESLVGKNPVKAPANNPAASPATTSGTSNVSANIANSSTPTAPVSTTASQPEPVAVSAKRDEETSGKILGRLGIGAVLLGVAFFLKYAFDNNWIGPTGRVMVGVLFGLAFLVVGQMLRSKYLKYSDLIMGGGSGILYLSFFSAFSFYHLITAPVAGVLMLVVTALTFAISIVNATPTLAYVGIIGAFLTPFLVNAYKFPGIDALMVFVYLSIINIGVLGISFFKKWPKLNVLSFVGTAINFLAWYGFYYNENYLAITLTFCFVTFLIFLVANISRSIVAGIKSDQADFFLIGANAFALAVMGYILLGPHHDSVLGFASVFVAIIYMIFAFTVNKSNPQDKALNIFLPGLAVTFLSIAVPLQFDGPWVAVAWLIESVALYFIASVISNRGFQVMGVVVYSLGLLDLIAWISDRFQVENFVPIFNKAFVITMLAVVVAYVIAFMYKKYGSVTIEIQKRGMMVFVVIANILTLFALTTQITNYYSWEKTKLVEERQSQTAQNQMYNSGYDDSVARSRISSEFYAKSDSLNNQSNTWVSILWTLYAAGLTAIGFAKRFSSVRRLGLALFLITAIKVLFDVWSLGELYRIISFIVFGLIALTASFVYVKYKDRLKDVV